MNRKISDCSWFVCMELITLKSICAGRNGHEAGHHVTPRLLISGLVWYTLLWPLVGANTQFFGADGTHHILCQLATGWSDFHVENHHWGWEECLWLPSSEETAVFTVEETAVTKTQVLSTSGACLLSPGARQSKQGSTVILRWTFAAIDLNCDAMMWVFQCAVQSTFALHPSHSLNLAPCDYFVFLKKIFRFSGYRLDRISTDYN